MWHLKNLKGLDYNSALRRFEKSPKEYNAPKILKFENEYHAIYFVTRKIHYYHAMISFIE